jgi:hypothetical protein
MSSSGTKSDSSASSDVDFDDYGEFVYQLEPEYTDNRVETNCSKVGVIGNAVTGFQLTIKQ